MSADGFVPPPPPLPSQQEQHEQRSDVDYDQEVETLQSEREVAPPTTHPSVDNGDSSDSSSEGGRGGLVDYGSSSDSESDDDNPAVSGPPSAVSAPFPLPLGPTASFGPSALPQEEVSAVEMYPEVDVDGNIITPSSVDAAITAFVPKSVLMKSKGLHPPGSAKPRPIAVMRPAPGPRRPQYVDHTVAPEVATAHPPPTKTNQEFADFMKEIGDLGAFES